MSAEDELTLAVEPIDATDVWPLVVALRDELDARYLGIDDVADAPDSDEYLAEITPEHVRAPVGTFVVARLGGHPVACGAVRPTERPEVGEVKRMYVVPEARGRGISHRVLARLEQEAAALGYQRLCLETGSRQPEAIALYRSAGWTPVEGYGPYCGHPLAHFFGKEL